MNTRLNITVALVALVASGTLTSTALSQEKVSLVYSDSISANDARSKILHESFGICMGEDFDIKFHHGATLFKQGTELAAMQRQNLDIAAIPIFDFENQVPETSFLGSAYLFRDYSHMRAVWDSGVLNDLEDLIEGRTQVKILSTPYIGTRHLNLRGDKKITVPADLKGVNLRMPAGESWSFVAEAMGANPTPMAFTEVYVGLQTGAIDGQENPLPLTNSMKFYEVTNQVVLSAHIIGTVHMTISTAKWNSLSANQQKQLGYCAVNFQNKLSEANIAQEAALIAAFEAKGLKVYSPDNEVFRSQVLEAYKGSEYWANMPAGVIEKINSF